MKIGDIKFRINKRQLITILVIVALGLIILNQYMKFTGVLKLLENPCMACEQLNYSCQKVYPIKGYLFG